MIKLLDIIAKFPQMMLHIRMRHWFNFIRDYSLLPGAAQRLTVPNFGLLEDVTREKDQGAGVNIKDMLHRAILLIATILEVSAECITTRGKPHMRRSHTLMLVLVALLHRARYFMCP